MNNVRYSTFINMAEMKKNGMICDEKALIHQRQIGEICRIIKDRMKYGEYDPTEKFKSENDVISIFARRGAGKTTFVKSLKKMIRSHVDDEFHGVDCSQLIVIDVIEPNQIQKKENFMIRFLASIHGKFLNMIKDKSENLQRQFDEATTALYEALPIIDGVGKFGMYTDWTDVDYVADNFMNLAMKAKDLELRFHEYINVALKILKKKSLLFILDDCDVNIEKTFEILETIRLYFTSPQIIVVMTGDANLYGMTVRQNYWKFFERDFLEKEYASSPLEDSKRTAYRKMVHRLETQYLQKMIKPEHRIFLDNVYEKYRLNKILEDLSDYSDSNAKYSIRIQFSDDNSGGRDIKVVYHEILSRLDLIFDNQADTDIFINHLLRQPFRNQYRLLSIYDDFLLNTPQNMRDNETAKVELTDRFLKVFEVYINQFSADNKHLMSKTSNYAAWIMKFLVDNNVVATGSHMLPNLESDSLSNALLAMAASCTRLIHTNPSIIFDFWIRVSFIRQILLTLGEEGKKLNEFAHIYHDSGVSKVLGNILAYTNAKLNPERESSYNTMAGVGIFNKKIQMRPGVKGQLVKLCQLATVVQNKQETRMFSIYRLMAAIAEILKTYEGIDEAMEDDRLQTMRINAIYNKLQHLSQIHYFVEPVDVKERNGEIDGEERISLIRRKKERVRGHDMAVSLYRWINGFQRVNKVTPYCIDRIFTRFYNNMNEIVPEGLVENAEIGTCMSKFVLCLWNACIVEDAIVRGELEEMTLDCNGGIEESFLSNYKAFLSGHNHFTNLPSDSFSSWMFNCPLLQCYADPYIMALAKIGEGKSPVSLFQYTLYKQKNIKEKIVKRNKTEIEALSKSIDDILNKLNFINNLNSIERTITIKKMEIESGNRSIEKLMKANEELKSLENQKLMLVNYAYYDEIELYEQLQKLHENKEMLEEQNKRLNAELDKNDLYKELPKDIIDSIEKVVKEAELDAPWLNVVEDLGCTD